MNLHVEMLTNVLLRFEDDEVLEVLEDLELEELELEELELEVAVLVVLVMILSNKDHTNVQLLQHALILLAHILANVMMDTLVMVKCALISMNV